MGALRLSQCGHKSFGLGGEGEVQAKLGASQEWWGQRSCRNALSAVL